MADYTFEKRVADCMFELAVGRLVDMFVLLDNVDIVVPEGRLYKYILL